jgi:hypothetical protein
VSRKVVQWCRATSFGVPIGPWRFGRKGARRDLMAEGLGSYDEDGCFYTTVPGGMDVREEWMSFDEAHELAQSVQRRNAAENLKRRSVTYKDRRVRWVRGPGNQPRGISFELLECSLSFPVDDDIQSSGE